MESSDDIDGFVHFQGFFVHMQHKENREVVVGFFFIYRFSFVCCNCHMKRIFFFTVPNVFLSFLKLFEKL